MPQNGAGPNGRETVQAVDSLRVALETSPRAEDVRIVAEGLQSSIREHLRTRAPIRRFSVFVRAGDGRVLGGVNARLAYGDLHIDQLWCEGRIRGNGYGAKLLERAEAFGRECGARLALLNTLDPARVAFYEAHGYGPMGRVDGLAAGQPVYFLKKEL